MKCLSNIELTEFLDNQSETGERERTNQHLKNCPACFSRLEHLKKDSQLLEQLKDSLNPSSYPEPFINTMPLKRSIEKTRWFLIPHFKVFQPAYITALVVGLGILLLSLLITQKSEPGIALSGPASAQSLPKILILETDGVPGDSIIFPDKTKSRLIVWVCKKKNKET